MTDAHTVAGLFIVKLVAVISAAVIAAAVVANENVFVPVWAALIITLGTIGTPLILRFFDWKRQDAVAQKVADAAALLVSSNERTTDTAEKTLETVKVIHTLVNSTLTAAIKAELDATIRELASLKKNKRDHANKTSIEFAENRIKELKSDLATRWQQQEIVDRGEAK